MKKLILAGLLCSSIFAQAGSYAFIIENPSPFIRTNQPVVLTTQQFGGSLPAGFPSVKFKGKTVAVQSDDLNKDGKPDELAMLVDLQVGEKALLKVSFSKKPPKKQESSGTFAKLIRLTDLQKKTVDSAFSARGELLDSLYNGGPFWGNDLIGARMRFDKQQRLEVFPLNNFNITADKKTSRLNIADSVSTSFSIDKTWSAGSFRGWNGKKSTFVEPMAGRTVRILAGGPVRTVVEMTADRWKYQKQTVQLTSRVVLYNKRNDLEIINFIQSEKLSNLTFCTGIQKSPHSTTRFTDHVLAVWGVHPSDADSVQAPAAGMALLCPEELISGNYREDNGNFLYLLKGFPVIRYHVLFRYENNRQEAAAAEAFFSSIPRWKQSITEPVLIRPKH